MKKLMILLMMGLMLYACSSHNDQNQINSQPTTEDDPNAQKIPTPGGEPPSYDPNRGSGKFSHVEVGKLNATMALNGEKVYNVKCIGCHKLTEEKLVGPGWKGVSQRHTPEWIMNFATNPDEMLNKDPKAQAMLEICLVRMPNQNIQDEEARNVLEFMRKNDGVK